ncbi:HAD domain-containing protein [Paraburkholderia tropica]|uniref:HAD domain-containing protein n=1 Tax=Paraburkholderia tropica TaxID=92647 RepID=UPI003016DC79
MNTKPFTMASSPSAPESSLRPLAADLRVLGSIIRERRRECGLDLLDAADYSDVDVAQLSLIEDGKAASTQSLFQVLRGFGLEMLILGRDDASDALAASGHTVNWLEVMEQRALTREHRKRTAPAELVLDNTTPTLLVDFDGTLHSGNAYIDDAGEITLDTGRPLLEYAPLLVELLAPYPQVEIVLTTSWARRLPEERVVAYLPPELRSRVVGTTSSTKPRRSYVLDGTERTDVIRSYAYGKRLKHWLAIDDAVFGAERFERVPGELSKHLLLLDSTKGIRDDDALKRIARWLSEVHLETE